MREIPLSGPKGKGLALLVDDDDYELMSKYKWYARKDQNGDISVGAWISAHNFLVPRTLTDHANGNPLDNTRANLREATPRQNSWNRKLRSDSTIGYKGVYLIKSCQRYRARIVVDDKRLYVGWFVSPIEAARAYDALARKHYGRFARLNFPDEPNYEVPLPPLRQCARPDCGKDFQSWTSDYCSRGCSKVATLPATTAATPRAYSGRRPRGDSLTGFKGVGRSGDRWQARIMRNGKRVFLGNYDAPETAARAYDAAARQLFGEHAWLNFPEEAA